MKIIENVIYTYREVVVIEVASSELGNSWTFAWGPQALLLNVERSRAARQLDIGRD